MIGIDQMDGNGDGGIQLMDGIKVKSIYKSNCFNIIIAFVRSKFH